MVAALQLPLGQQLVQAAPDLPMVISELTYNELSCAGINLANIGNSLRETSSKRLQIVRIACCSTYAKEDCDASIEHTTLACSSAYDLRRRPAGDAIDELAQVGRIERHLIGGAIGPLGTQYGRVLVKAATS